MSFMKKELVPRVQDEEIPKGATYTARFISAGPVGYKDGTYLLDEADLDSFAYTLKGCPVLVGHRDILDQEQMKKEAVGYVSEVKRTEDGWFADFVIFDEKTIDKIGKGDLPFVSCAYRAELAEGTTINNVEYKKRIIGGEMLHLALVKNPRYNGTEIWRNSTDEYFVSEGALYNEKENAMFGFKKTKVELDKETLINTSLGDKTIEELINDLEETVKKVSEQEAEIETLKTSLKEAEEKLKEKEVSEGDDKDLKEDLNNSLTEEIKVEVIKVPNVTLTNKE